ncbi:CPBP family intramembrane glutamic endopeptidase [Candidatus Enterococcus ferrettii]|uniref:CAAX prenyl protease 2/Lysostaphin resistance protein A-like domain-containing protein n=1 Tax=Candidatus Enterococcus ferrettii TaxID=2815324 RepID=A0ABV0ETQ8_9ENTE|nr:type II CAAX endopeptidase family protein [Enterococcus sp. 665A]MBO1342179.1 CPBP family intramembrane metalloprotease [Enterococcus sp. 665A]
MERKNQMNIVLRIILWFLMMCVATLPTTVVMITGSIKGITGVIVGAVILLAMLALAVFVAAKSDIWTKNGRSFMGKAMKLGPSIGLAIGAGLFLRVWVVVLNMIIPINTANDQALQGLAGGQTSSILLFFSMVVMAPVLEELVFRGFVFKFFFRENRLFAYLLSSLLFTLIHVPTDLISFVTYGSLALVMGFVYYKTNRIEMSMLTHAINNLLPALVLAFLS